VGRYRRGKAPLVNKKLVRPKAFLTIDKKKAEERSGTY
jgi:hypothetical protein